MRAWIAIASLISFTGSAQIKNCTLLSHSFEETVIRSHAVNNVNVNELLVGTKGDKPGTGKVYLTRDAGETWIALNDGKALCNSCEDVQSLCFINSSTFLAGTWKNGLFISEDGGNSFRKVEDFPSQDIRDFEQSSGDRNIIYAATTTHGIMRSNDAGLTWYQTAPDSLNKDLAAWSIELPGWSTDEIYAMTFRNGIMKSFDGGTTWEQVLYQEGLMFWELVKAPNGIMYTVGSNDTLSILLSSINGGYSWQVDANTPSAGVNTIDFIERTEKIELLVGSWDAGAFLGNQAEYASPNNNWTHLSDIDSSAISGIHVDYQNIFIFTWGDGIYKYERQPQCNIYIAPIAYFNCNYCEETWEIQPECEVDYLDFSMFSYSNSGYLIEHLDDFKDLNPTIDKLIEDKTLLEGEYGWVMKISFEGETDTLDMNGRIDFINS